MSESSHSAVLALTLCPNDATATDLRDPCTLHDACGGVTAPRASFISVVFLVLLLSSSTCFQGVDL